jgi:23S rRNA G2069 N7-methylase RlmK/C1962 C5-methylase RlmI
VIAEIAAANAAFKIIKTAISHGKELYDCSAAAQSYFDNKSAIAKRVASKGKNDLEAFMAMEKIKEQEEWLKDYMIYAGRADMYSDWLSFQSECKKKRDKKARLAAQARRETIKLLKQFITVIGIAIAVIPVIIYAIIFMVKR